MKPNVLDGADVAVLCCCTDLLVRAIAPWSRVHIGVQASMVAQKTAWLEPILEDASIKVSWEAFQSQHGVGAGDADGVDRD